MSAGYERFSAQDSSFLVFEDPNTHMHLGGIAIFDPGPLATADGGVDIERIRRHVESRLHWIPRYRQRVAYVPLERHPVWVDDDHFNLSYHVRHTSLPRPGDEEQLKRLAGRIMSQRLDRRRPLWEIWIVEGLEGGRFAMVTKTHHCMVDGVAAVDLNAVLLSPTPEHPQEEAPPWEPRPTPAPLALLRDEALRQVRRPLDLVRWLGNAVQRSDLDPSRLLERATAAWETIGAGLRGAARTPLNQPIGPHRRFDWLTLDLGEVKGVKERFGGTVNDVVLATVAGAVRRFLRHRQLSLEGMDFRIVVPVSVRSEDERGRFTNRASGWIMSLPIQERDPRRRLSKVRTTTKRLKESNQASGVEVLTQLAESVGSAAVSLGTRFASRLAPYNLIVTNIPGPQVPLFMLGARLRAGYPTVPLFENQGLGVATFSYAGQLCWGFNADWDLVPDLHEFVRALEDSFRELAEAAGIGDLGTARGPAAAGAE